MDGTDRPSRLRHGRKPRPPFWLLTRHRYGRTEVLCAELVAGLKALPVFSSAEEARLFVRHGLFEGAGWRAEEISAVELAALLLGSLEDMGRVALDPLPGIGSEPVNRLLCLRRETFLDLFSPGG